ncbi:hypothetical protein [Lactobacillus crispatus]|uniref:Uncharacterized protein n=1 Tax=Lactobacillus crispatus (strain ST1) TaxID=748671 RepID=D5H256_LACCS|nr:hypothetical protein [Lactobacillus crispatus]CBL50091.1 putative protein without homology [Lactobacillus crispatus ST1]
MLEIETLFSTTSGYNYWKIIEYCPHCNLVRQTEEENLVNWLLDLKGFGTRYARNTAAKLKKC